MGTAEDITGEDVGKGQSSLLNMFRSTYYFPIIGDITIQRDELLRSDPNNPRVLYMDKLIYWLSYRSDRVYENGFTPEDRTFLGLLD